MDEALLALRLRESVRKNVRSRAKRTHGSAANAANAPTVCCVCVRAKDKMSECNGTPRVCSEFAASLQRGCSGFAAIKKENETAVTCIKNSMSSSLASNTALSAESCKETGQEVRRRERGLGDARGLGRSSSSARRIEGGAGAIRGRETRTAHTTASAPGFRALSVGSVDLATAHAGNVRAPSVSLSPSPAGAAAEI